MAAQCSGSVSRCVFHCCVCALWMDKLFGLQLLSSPGPSLVLLELLPSSRFPQSLELPPFSDHPVLRLCALPHCLPASSFCVHIVVNKLYSPCSFWFWVLPCQTLTIYLTSKSQHPFTAIIKLGRVRFFLYNSDCIRMKEKNCLVTWSGLRVCKSWNNFNFGWTIPLNHIFFILC